MWAFSLILVRWLAMTSLCLGQGETKSVIPSLPPSCTPEFQEEADHTMCLYDNPNLVTSGVISWDEYSIIDMLNALREKVEPQAEALTKVYWNDDLAAVANKWAKQCTLGHDSNRNIPSFRGIQIGQNIAANVSSWEQVFQIWKSQGEKYTYLGDSNVYEDVRFYTQMIHGDTHLVGCGYAKCNGTSLGNYYVCNFAEGQSPEDIVSPYTSGRNCSACGHDCYDSLCDCGGLLCLNGGTLNTWDCSCNCPDYYAGENCSKLCDGPLCLNGGRNDPDDCSCICPLNYAGTNCDTLTLTCPKKDWFLCVYYTTVSCQRYRYIPGSCPYLCGLCSKEAVDTTRFNASNPDP